METTRVRINIHSGEVEIQGSEEFVEKQVSQLGSLLRFLDQKSDQIPEGENINIEKETDFSSKRSAPKKASPVFKSPSKKEKVKRDSLNPKGNFSDFVLGFKKGLSEADRCLMAAFYLQHNSPAGEFKTIEISGILKREGLKPSNPSASISSLLKRKLISQTRTQGDKIKMMKVSSEGKRFLEKKLV